MKEELAMKGINMLISVGITVALAVMATGAAISAEDRYSLKVPAGRGGSACLDRNLFGISGSA
jgi:hypothetical protein